MNPNYFLTNLHVLSYMIRKNNTRRNNIIYLSMSSKELCIRNQNEDQ